MFKFLFNFGLFFLNVDRQAGPLIGRETANQLRLLCKLFDVSLRRLSLGGGVLLKQ